MPRRRPFVVTAGAGLALVAGVLGAVAALFALTGGAPQAFLMLPFNLWFTLIVSVILGLGAVLALSGIGALRGSTAARRVLLVTYGLVGFFGITAAAVWPKLVGLVSLAGLVLLVTPQAKTWFGADR